MAEAMVFRRALACDVGGLAWEPFRDGIDIAWLYRNGEHGPAAAFLRYRPGARVPFHLHGGYEHVLILQGSQTDRSGRNGAGTLVVNPPGSAHDVVSEDGCVVLIIWERPVILQPDLQPM
jgi:anti-sigma factor ChrR (cupin superfamily)